jgi:hypothetical protein
MTACVPQKQYYWGNYSSALYDYYTDSTQLADYRQALVVIVQEGEAERRVPPGIYAELGYLELQAGNVAEAKRYFEREKERWPESAVFMDRMIAAIGQPEGTPRPADAAGNKPAGS